MSGAAGGAAGAAAAAAAVARAIKASGTIVRLDPEEWRKIVTRQEQPVVVRAWGGFLFKTNQYLTSYKGLAFYTKSPEPISLPPQAELVEADRIWIP